MESRFRRIKKIITVLFTILVITQLASCTAPPRQEGLKSTDKSSDTSMKDENQQTTETGLISSEEKQELSGDALIEYFQKVYDIHMDIHTSTTAEGLLQEELDFLVSFVESDGEKLPSDYEAQYRAWRPETLPADIQPLQNQQGQEPSHQQSSGQQATQNQTGQANNQQAQGQQQTSGQEQQGQTQTSQPSGGAYDPYDGYGSYNAMIDAYCKRYPELSREEIMQRNPDPATGQVNEAAARADAAEDRLRGG